MHYRKIILTMAEDREEALDKATDFMDRQCEIGDACDWYQIGGRWTGLLDGYDPHEDEANIVTCELCGGTGDRPDLGPPEWKEHCGGCNGCCGKGVRTVWPTRFAEHLNDAMPLADCLEKVREICSTPEEAVAEVTEFWGGVYPDSLARDLSKIKNQAFDDVGTVFNIETRDWSIPDDPAGWWAVVVDMHC